MNHEMIHEIIWTDLIRFGCETINEWMNLIALHKVCDATLSYTCNQAVQSIRELHGDLNQRALLWKQMVKAYFKTASFHQEIVNGNSEKKTGKTKFEFNLQ